MGDGATERAASPTAASPATSRRRWFRFSLRTLPVFVLLAGSGMGLWWKWSPRVRSCTVSAHVGSRDAIQFSPDSGRLLVGDMGGVTSVVDVRTGKSRATCLGHTAQIDSVRFSADGRLVVTASHDGTTRVWDPENGREKAVLRDEGSPVFHAAFAPSAKMMASSVAWTICLATTWQTPICWAILNGMSSFVIPGLPGRPVNVPGHGALGNVPWCSAAP